VAERGGEEKREGKVEVVRKEGRGWTSP